MKDLKYIWVSLQIVKELIRIRSRSIMHATKETSLLYILCFAHCRIMLPILPESTASDVKLNGLCNSWGLIIDEQTPLKNILSVKNFPLSLLQSKLTVTSYRYYISAVCMKFVLTAGIWGIKGTLEMTQSAHTFLYLRIFPFYAKQPKNTDGSNFLKKKNYI